MMVFCPRVMSQQVSNCHQLPVPVQRNSFCVVRRWPLHYYKRLQM